MDRFGDRMTTRQIGVRRVSVTSARKFDDVMAIVDGAIGHPDMAGFRNKMAAAKDYSEMQSVIEAAVGKYDLMEFARFDIGAVLRKALGPGSPNSVRLVVGNPLIMQSMTRHVPDTASYAPVTILIDERPDGVHLYENPEALRIARDLDAKVIALLVEAAGA